FKKIIFEDFLPKLNFNEFQRIAIGTVGIQKIETFKEGLENLKFYLPYIQIDIENSKDFLFQINKPKNIDVLNRNININQITKWSVMEYKYLVVNNNLIQNLLGNQFGFRLETDINTAQDENTNKSKEFVKSIIEKEIQTSIDYFDKGDTNVNTNYA
ncbi:MAG: hypothetical protein KDK36_04060, partial [Leptospiraceae bacterium]|nr:hypothetical protein [Leptospiraceae bacterium]